MSYTSGGFTTLSTICRFLKGDLEFGGTVKK